MDESISEFNNSSRHLGASWWAELIVVILRFGAMFGIAVMAFCVLYSAFQWPAVAIRFGASSGIFPKIWMSAYLVAGMALVVLLYTVLTHLLRVLTTVTKGDPFIRDNAVRLRKIGTAMTWMMILDASIGFSTGYSNGYLPHLKYDSDFSIYGVLSILLVFSLAHVFEKGVTMREESEGTI